MKKWIISGLLIIVITAAGVQLLFVKPKSKTLFAKVSHVLSEDNSASGFERAIHQRNFQFPEDLGSHDRYQTEWWYFTGNLKSSNGRPFGYQLTFFRRAIRNRKAKGPSKWRTNQLYLSHFAISDINNNAFLSFERYSRGSLGLAGAIGTPFRVWLEDWKVAENRNNGWDLEAKVPGVSLHLRLNPLKPMIFNGEAGLSQKGPEMGNASYYFSNTRIDTKGDLRIQDQSYEVSGFSWMDREWSTSALSRNQIGWDWFSIQLDDWREIMLFQIRKANGGISEFSSGSFVDKNGRKSHLKKDQFDIKLLDQWRSPETSKLYPSAWQIRIPSKKIDISVTSMMDNQEHRHSFAYWEGAVKIDGEGVSGIGYVELTGYSP